MRDAVNHIWASIYGNAKFRTQPSFTSTEDIKTLLRHVVHTKGNRMPCHSRVIKFDQLNSLQLVAATKCPQNLCYMHDAVQKYYEYYEHVVFVHVDQCCDLYPIHAFSTV